MSFEPLDRAESSLSSAVNNIYVNFCLAKTYKERIAIRMSSIALPALELQRAAHEGIGTIFTLAPKCVIKLCAYTLIFIFQKDDYTTYVINLPGPIDVLKGAAKTVFCATAIFWSCPLAFCSPKKSALLHYKLGLSLTMPNTLMSSEKETGFDCIVGMDASKAEIEKIIRMLNYKSEANDYDRKFSNGILLYGVPGTGKTFFAQKVAQEIEKQTKKLVHFSEISFGQTGSMMLHGTAKNLAATFNLAAKKAQENQSISVVFIDEIDTVITKNGVVSKFNSFVDEERGAFLKHIAEASQKQIIVIAATNHAEYLDKALVRDGRIGNWIEIPLPDEEMRKSLFKKFLLKVPKDPTIDYDSLANQTNELNVAAIEEIAQFAKGIAFDQEIERLEGIKSSQEDKNSHKILVSQEMLQSAIDHHLKSSKTKQL